MLKFNNSHIFTGYLKQLLSSISIPACKIYTQEYENYYKKYNKEDPRIVKSFNTILKRDVLSTSSNINAADSNFLESKTAFYFNYLKHDQVMSYVYNLKDKNCTWIPQTAAKANFSSDRIIDGLTKKFTGYGNVYDTKTHEYLGDFLRFIRDYANINLMPLYNCFNNKLCANIYFSADIGKSDQPVTVTFDSTNADYKIYAIPVKLFSEYTIAIECSQAVEFFCGFYGTNVDTSLKAVDFFTKTYEKVYNTKFNQPIIYDKLSVKYWPDDSAEKLLSKNLISRCDIMSKEYNLKLFIKVPVSCKSTITILEGNYANFNDSLYTPHMASNSSKEIWEYKANHTVLNFEMSDTQLNTADIPLITKLQLLAFNTKESYPFSDRLIEYLGGSVILPSDAIVDNIRRVQRVLAENGYYAKVEGAWENKIQKIIYDYLINSGTPEIINLAELEKANKIIKNEKDYSEYYIAKSNITNTGTTTTLVKKSKKNSTGEVLINPETGKHPSIGLREKSMLYDVLGYVDSDAEKFYTHWGAIEEATGKGKKIIAKETIQNINIYPDEHIIL